MKMSQEHFEMLSAELDVALATLPKPLTYYRDSYRRHNNPMRFRWDCYWVAYDAATLRVRETGEPHPFSVFTDTLKDTHIDTALRCYMHERGEEWAALNTDQTGS